MSKGLIRHRPVQHALHAAALIAGVVGGDGGAAARKVLLARPHLGGNESMTRVFDLKPSSGNNGIDGVLFRNRVSSCWFETRIWGETKRWGFV